MKLLFLSTLAASFIGAAVWAQSVNVEKTMECAPTSLFLKGLSQSEYKEMPIWSGSEDSSYYSLFVNEKTKTWTLIQFNEKIACVLGSGLNSKMIYNNLVSK